MNTQNKIANKRKLKYGAMAVALTVVVIAAIIITNIIFSALAYKNNWYVDLTAEKVYGLTDAGRELLDGIDENAKIDVHFCAPFDQLESNYYMKMVFELVKEMAAEYDNISYDYIDTVENPSAIIKYKKTATDTITPESIIVESGTEFRVFTLSAMFMIDTESQAPFAFNGEHKLVSAMVACSLAEKPVAYYTNTHGEYTPTALLTLFEDAGYEVLPIDLTKEDPREDARVLIISNPQYDFEGISELTAGRKSEIEKIDDFLDGFGNLMVFMTPQSEGLPELEAFLYEWGITFENAVLRDPSNSIDVNHYAIVGDYSLESTLGGALVKDIVSVATPPKTIAYYANPIKLVYEYKDNRQTSTAVYSSKNAEKYVGDEMVEKGRYPLVTISRESRYIDNISYSSNVFAFASPFFAEEIFLAPTYGNSDILYTAMLAMGKKQVPIDLDFKMFEDNSLDITTAEASAWTWSLTLIVPTLVFVTGIVIWLRRKHA